MSLTKDGQVLVICSMILYIKIIITFVLQSSKMSANERPPEDGQMNASSNKQDIETGDQSNGDTEYTADTNAQTKESKAISARWQRIIGNDLENIPFGLIFGWAAFIASGNETVNMVAMIVFTVARILHTIFYAHAVQPFRSLSWAFGMLSILVLAGNAIHGAFHE